MEIQKITDIQTVLDNLSAHGFCAGTINPKIYHDWKAILPNCISKSGLSDFVSNPYEFDFNKRFPAEREESKALRFGSLVDCLALTPHLFPELYHVSSVSRRTKEGQALLKELKEKGKTLIDPQEYESAIAAADNACATFRNEFGEDKYPQTFKQCAIWMKLEKLWHIQLAAPLTICGMLD